MAAKNAMALTAFCMVAAFLAGPAAGLDGASAQEEAGIGYKMADGIYGVFTFTFEDGVETHLFPVFDMGYDLVENRDLLGFSVEGVVGDAPHLHKALDEAFRHKQNPRYGSFEVDIDFIKDGQAVRTLAYHGCRVDDYKVRTLADDYESYMSSKTGFAIVDHMEFLCAGLSPMTGEANPDWQAGHTATVFGPAPYDFSEDIRTSVLFEFDEGAEQIEFPYFELTSGFEEEGEEDGNSTPSFSVEGTIQKHPLLNKAIDIARNASGYLTDAGVDFEATVKFTKGGDVLRTLEFGNCRVSAAKMSTLADREEGFTGKSGFAIVEAIGFQCIGLSTADTSYDGLRGDAPVWGAAKTVNVLSPHEHPLGTGPRAVATFTFDDGVEVIDFPIFRQGDILAKPNPTFELEGLVRDSPMLHKRVDDNLALTSTAVANTGLFNVDVALVRGDGQAVRGFNYADCRVSDYAVKSQRDKEESYFKGFALSNTFDFTCRGYHPNNPAYDAVFATHDKASTVSTLDLRSTDAWGPGFYAAASAAEEEE